MCLWLLSTRKGGINREFRKWSSEWLSLFTCTYFCLHSLNTHVCLRLKLFFNISQLCKQWIYKWPSDLCGQKHYAYVYKHKQLHLDIVESTSNFSYLLFEWLWPGDLITGHLNNISQYWQFAIEWFLLVKVNRCYYLMPTDICNGSKVKLSSR